MASDPQRHDGPASAGQASDAGHVAATGHDVPGGHDEHGEDGEPLGPIDRQAWGAALLGLVVALIVAGAFWVATAA